MYIITGGAFQGKWSYAQRQTGLPETAFVDGETIEYEEIFHAEGIVNFHLYVRRYLTGQKEEELEAFAGKLYEENPDLVLVTDEVGSGIVPMDPEERAYREAVGRVCTFLACRAQRVDRVVCGIGMVLQLKPDAGRTEMRREMTGEIRICLVRHGKTEGNVRRGYIGCRTDEDLCEDGRRELEIYKSEGRYPAAERLYRSPMKRCLQTAEIIWPELLSPETCRVVEDFRECDFGAFDGKSYAELSGVPDFQHWVESDGMGAFPGGEDPKDFRRRTSDAFLAVTEELFADGIRNAAFAVHGGTIMSVMAAFGDPEKSYYDWHVWNGDGFLVTVSEQDWRRTHRFRKIERLLPAEDTEG